MVGTHRRLAVTLLLVVGVLLVVALGSSWLLVRVWGPSFTASRIAAAITEATGRPAHVDGVVLEPLLGRVRISGLTAAGEHDLLVRVERVDVAIRIESLWRRELVVGIAVHGADVRIQPGPAPSEPMAFEMPERFQLGPITARLASIALERSRLRFEDPPRRMAIALDGLAATGRPERGGLELTARADLMHLSVVDFQEKLEHLRAEGRIDAARILVRRLELNDPRHEIRATASIEAPWSRDPTLAGEAKARLAAGPIAQRLGAAVAVDGAVTVDLTLSGALAAPVLAGRLRAEQLAAAGIQARDLSGTLRLDDQAFTVADVEGRVLGGRLRASLTMPAGRPQESLARLRLDDIDAAALARLQAGSPDAHGRLALDGEVRGDLGRPMTLSGQLRVDGSELSLPGALGRLGVGRLRATARMADGQVVADAEGRWPSASLTAQARVEPDHRLRVEARARADLSGLPGWTTGDSIEIAARGEGRWPQATLTAGVALARPAARRDAGRLDVRLDPMAGTAPRWSGTLQARRLTLPWVDVEDLQSALALSTDALDVARLTARVAGIPVDGSGRWTWRGSGDARLVVGPAALARLPGVPPELALDGSARAQVEARLSTAGVQGTARVEAERVAVAKIALGRGTGEATLQGRRLEAALRFPDRRLEMSARGDLAPGQMVAARMVLRSFDLASLVAPHAGEAPMLRGVISASAELAIPADAPGNLRGRLTLDPTTIGVAGASWSSAASIVARLDGQRATLEPLRLTGPAGTISAGGVVWDAGARPLVHAKLEGGRLAALAPTLGLDGRVQVEAELSGDAGAMAGTRARARAVGDGLALPGALARLGKGAGQADLQLADGVLSITRGDVTFPGLTGGVTGRINLDGRIALEARATAQGGPVGTALGWSESGGTVTATATLGGRLSQLDGQARISSERIAVAGIAVERLDAAARLQGETLRLERLTARVLGAPLRARGEWAMSGSGRAELDAGPLALAQIPAPRAARARRLAVVARGGHSRSRRAEGSGPGAGNGHTRRRTGARRRPPHCTGRRAAPRGEPRSRRAPDYRLCEWHPGPGRRRRRRPRHLDLGARAPPAPPRRPFRHRRGGHPRGPPHRARSVGSAVSADGAGPDRARRAALPWRRARRARPRRCELGERRAQARAG